MFNEERKIKIMNILNSEKSATVNRLAEQFRVSPSTIRRDLTAMEQSGLIVRSHGGVMIKENVRSDLNFNEKRVKDYDLKNAIGQRAAALVDDGDTIALNSSTITTLMAEHISAHDITIVTNSINIINIVRHRNNCQIIMLGGIYMSNAQTIEGPTTTDQISQLHFDKVFFGVNGVDLQVGLSSASELEAKSKIAMMAHSNSSYCLCEHAKFKKTSLFKIASVNEVDAIITDWEIDEAIIEEYSGQANIMIANPL